MVLVSFIKYNDCVVVYKMWWEGWVGRLFEYSCGVSDVVWIFDVFDGELVFCIGVVGRVVCLGYCLIIVMIWW